VNCGETLEQLEGYVWPVADYDSYLVSTVHRLRKKLLAEFTAEDLRIMIGQGVGLPHLMPLAIEVLERKPLAEGDFYPGDLLSTVVGADSWLMGQPELASRVVAVARLVLADPGDAEPELLGRVAAFMERAR
jgi:CDI immunity proteins